MEIMPPTFIQSFTVTHALSELLALMPDNVLSRRHDANCWLFFDGSCARHAKNLRHNKQKKQAIIESDGTNITSPIVGTAYLAPEPGGKKFVEVGQKIKKGQTIMIVEAMKTMNHVPSTNDGVVKKVLVNDGQPVEFGQPLIILK